MRLVRLNWVAKGQTITDESSGTRASDVRDLEAISHWHHHSKNTHLYLVRETLARNFIHAETHRSPTSLRIFLSLSLSLLTSFPSTSFSLSNIQEDRARSFTFIAGINTLNSFYTSGSGGNAILFFLSFFGIRSSRAANEETPRKPRKRRKKNCECKIRETVYKNVGRKCFFSVNQFNLLREWSSRAFIFFRLKSKSSRICVDRFDYIKIWSRYGNK